MLPGWTTFLHGGPRRATKFFKISFFLCVSLCFLRVTPCPFLVVAPPLYALTQHLNLYPNPLRLSRLKHQPGGHRVLDRHPDRFIEADLVG